MDSSPEFVGRLIAALIFASPAIYFLDRGLRAGARSRRLADLALFCGLAAFVLPEIALGWSPAERSGIFLASGAARIVIGIAGITLAITALLLRQDGGVGVVRPMLGTGFSLFHVLIGSGLLLFVNFAHPSTPWTYQSPDGAFRLTLPSSQWRQAQNGAGPAFVCPIPRMHAKVIALKQEQTEADFARTVEGVRAHVAASSELSRQAKFQEGTNAAGNPHLFFTAMDSSPEGKQVYVAHSVTWCARQHAVVEVLFEGLVRNRSQFGKATELGAFEKSAATICQSIE